MLSKISLFSVATATAGKCPFGYDSQSSNDSVAQVRPTVRTEDGGEAAPPAYPSEIFTCAASEGGKGIPTTESMDKDKYKQIVREVITRYESIDNTKEDNNNPRAKFAACIVRAVGHDFMDYRKDAEGNETGGADGCIVFADDDNIGLSACLQNMELAAIYEDHCTTVSIADFLIIAAEAMMGRTSEDYDPNDMFFVGGLPHLFLEDFKYGRTTALTCDSVAGRMPNPEDGCDGLSNIFIDHIYK
jgi:hypothetical protein